MSYQKSLKSFQKNCDAGKTNNKCSKSSLEKLQKEQTSESTFPSFFNRIFVQESLDTISNVTSLKCNFLQWASLRSAIPDFLRYKEDDVSNLEQLGFYHNNTFFDASEARSKHYYNLQKGYRINLPLLERTYRRFIFCQLMSVWRRICEIFNIRYSII